MIDEQAIDEISEQFEGWKTQKLLVSLKSFAGSKYIDCRKWADYNGKMGPSKGMMLSIKDWPKAIRMIQEMIDRHSGKVK